MNKEELAEHIKDRVVLIGTDLKHLETIQKYSKNHQSFDDAFVTIYLSLQNTVFIELFKLFDTGGEDSKTYNIYALISKIDDENKTYYKKLSRYKEDIDAIKNRRNKLIAHETGVNPLDIFNNNKIKSLQELLQCIVDICCDANDKLHPNTYVSNVKAFDNWCYMATASIKEICEINGKLIDKKISKEMFNENLDSFIDELKQKKQEEMRRRYSAYKGDR